MGRVRGVVVRIRGDRWRLLERVGDDVSSTSGDSSSRTTSVMVMTGVELYEEVEAV